MAKPSPHTGPARPERLVNAPLPPFPEVDGQKADEASVTYSHYRTTLSRHRTDLSEHRTDLSEYRTDLSGERTELSMRRTGMSLQRTRMSADNTLMSVVRTALSLIGFGFTIYQGFEKLRQADVITNAGAPRNFGLALILIGMLLLVGGLINHVRYMVELRHLRGEMRLQGLIHGETRFPISIIFLAALALLVVGIVATSAIAVDIAGRA